MDYIKRSVSGLIQGALNHRKPPQQTSAEKAAQTEANAALTHEKASNVFVTGVQRLDTAIQAFGDWVQQFAQTVNGSGATTIPGSAGTSFADTINALGDDLQDMDDAAQASGDGGDGGNGGFGGPGLGGSGRGGGGYGTAASDADAVVVATRAVEQGAQSGSAAGTLSGLSQAAGQLSKVASGTPTGKVSGYVSSGLEAGAQAAKGDDTNAALTVAQSGAFGPQVAMVAGVISAGLAVASIVGGLFRRKPDYKNVLSQGQYSSAVGTGDHTGLIDTSSASGVEGLRNLGRQYSARSGGAGGNVTHNVAIHPGAITVYAAANHNEQEVANQVLGGLSKQIAMDNAARGTS